MMNTAIARDDERIENKLRRRASPPNRESIISSKGVFLTRRLATCHDCAIFILFLSRKISQTWGRLKIPRS